MKEVPWDDDDVNAQSKFFQRGAKYDELLDGRVSWQSEVTAE